MVLFSNIKMVLFGHRVRHNDFTMDKLVLLTSPSLSMDVPLEI
jgi:hypothetical protein